MLSIKIPRSRILDLMRAQCALFNTTFNPTQQRLGNKILRERLKGPAVASYYPPRVNVIRELRREYPDWRVEDEAEDLRLEGLRLKKLRGKGAPKKRRSAEESKALQSKKKNQMAPGGRLAGGEAKR